MSTAFLQRSEGYSSNNQEEQRKNHTHQIQQKTDANAELDYINSLGPNTGWNIADVDPVIAQHVSQKYADKSVSSEAIQKMPVNTNQGLEKEADLLGSKAAKGENVHSQASHNPQNTIALKPNDTDDYGIGIDHTQQNKTITVSANIYARDAATALANQQAANLWNNYSGATYTTRDGTVYTINFNIQVINENSPQHEGRAEVDPIGNSVNDITSDANFEQEYNRLGGNEKSEDVGGYTVNNKHIRNRNSNATTNTRAHEIGHLFFLNEYEGGGVMSYQDDLNKVKPVSKKNIKKVIKRIIRQIKKQTRGTRTQEGIQINIQGKTDRSFFRGKISI